MPFKSMKDLDLLSYAIKLWSWDFHLSNEMFEICDEDKFANSDIDHQKKLNIQDHW